MNDNTGTEKYLRASIAANTRWAHEPDRTAAMRPANEGRVAAYRRRVDPDGVLTDAERERRAESLMRADMRRLALRSVQARRRAREATEALRAARETLGLTSAGEAS